MTFLKNPNKLNSLNTFLTIVESFVVFKIIKDENTRESIDGIAKLCFPLLFLIGTYGVMFKSLYNKSIVYNKLVHGDEIGISKDLSNRCFEIFQARLVSRAKS